MANDTNVRVGASRSYDVDPTVAVGNRRLLIRPLSWTAILAGTAIAFVTQLTLTMLGIGIGLATVDPMTEADPARGLGTGAAVWAAISALISLGLGGYVAGHMAGVSRLANGLIHGVLVWAVVVLLSVTFVATSAANLIGGGLSALGQTAGSIDAGTFREITGAADDAAGSVAANEQQIRARADQAAEVASRTAFWTFVALLLGAVAGGAGGVIGRSRAPAIAPTDEVVGTPAMA